MDINLYKELAKLDGLGLLATSSSTTLLKEEPSIRLLVGLSSESGLEDAAIVMEHCIARLIPIYTLYLSPKLSRLFNWGAANVPPVINYTIY